MEGMAKVFLLTAVESLLWSKRKAMRPMMRIILGPCIDCTHITTTSSDDSLHD